MSNKPWLNRLKDKTSALLGLLLFFSFVPVAYTQNVFYHLLPHAIAPFTWVGLAADANWTSPQNWSSGVIPGASNVAIFDENCSINCSATINTNISISGILMKNSYSGTITQANGNTITIGSAGWTQSTGTFIGGDSQFTINDGFVNLSGNAVFTATKGQTYFNNSVAHGNFDILKLDATNTLTFPDNSTAKFSLPGACGTPKYNIVSPVKVSFYNFIAGSSGTGCGQGQFGNTAATIEIRNDFSYITAADVVDFKGNYEIYGNMSSVANLNSDAVFYALGAASKTYEGPGGLNYLVVNKTGGATLTPKTGTVLLTVNGISVLSGGFTFPITLNIIKRNSAPLEWFKIASGTTIVTPANSTVNLDAWADCGNPIYPIDVDTTYSFESLTIIGSHTGCGNAVLTKAAGDTIIVKKSFTPSNLVSINFDINLEGNLLAGTGNPIGTMAVTFQNTAAESATMNSPFTTGNWNVNKTSGTVTLAGNISLTNPGQDLDITSGILNMNGKNLVINDTLTIAANGKLICNGGFLSAATYVLVGEYSCGTYIGITWTGATGDHLWSTPGNWTNNNVPGVGDIAVFNGMCTGANCNVTLDTNVSLKGIKFDSTYTGTFTQGAYTMTANSSGWIQNGGTFIGGSGFITVTGSMTLNAGSFTSTTGTLLVGHSLSIVTPAAQFIHNSGTLELAQNASYFADTISTGTTIFNNVSVTGSAFSQSKNIAGNIFVDGNFSCSAITNSAILNTGTISVKGNLSFLNVGCAGSALIEVVGNSNQSITGTSTAYIPSFKINSTGGTVSFVGSLLFQQNFTYTAGTVNAGTSNAIFRTVDYTAATITTTTALAFNNVTIDGSAYSSTKIIVGTMKVAADFNCSTVTNYATLTTGDIRVLGNINYSGAGCMGNNTVRVMGSTDQTITGTATAYIANLEINSTGGTVYLAGTLRMWNNLTYTAGNVNAGTSTVLFQLSDYSASVITVSNSIQFNNVSFDGYAYASQKIISGLLVVNGALTCNATYDPVVITGNISARGDLVFSGFGCLGTTTITVEGSGNQLVTGSATAYIPNFKVNSSGGIVTFAGTLRFRYDFTYTTGTVDAGTSTALFQLYDNGNNNLTVNSSLVFYNVQFAGFAVNIKKNIIGAMVVGGALTCDSQVDPVNINNGTISVRGNMSFTSNGCLGTTVIKAEGSGNQTITGVSSAYIPDFVINSSGGTVTLAGSLRFRYNFTYTAGTVDAGTSTAIFYGYDNGTNNLTVNNSINFNNVSFQGYFVNNTKNIIGSMIVKGWFKCEANLEPTKVTTGSISVSGNIYFYTSGCNGDAALSLDGTSTVNLYSDGPSAKTFTQTMTVNKTGGASVILTANLFMNTAQNLTISSGTLNLNTYTLNVPSTLTVGTGTTLFCNGGDFASASLTNNGTINCPGFAAYQYHWTGAGGNTNWNTPGNWSGGVVPNSAGLAAFSNTYCGATCNVTINVDPNVNGIKIYSGYTGTLTQASGVGIRLGKQGLRMAGGTFVGSNSNIDIYGMISITGGTFTSTSAELTAHGLDNAADNFIISSPSYFIHNSGTVSLASAVYADAPVAVNANNVDFYNLRIRIYDNYRFVGFSGSINTRGTLSIESGGDTSGGTINAYGDINYISNYHRPTTIINIVGNNNQTLNGASTTTRLHPTVINKTGGTLTFTNSFAISNNFTYTAGTVNAGTSTVSFGTNDYYDNGLTVTTGSLHFNNVIFNGFGSSRPLTLSGIVRADGNVTFTGDNTNLSAGTIEVMGNLTYSANQTSVLPQIKFTGAGTQIVSAGANHPSAGNWTVAKTAGSTLRLANNVLINAASQTLTVTSGTVDMNGMNLTIGSNLILSGNTITKNAGVLTVNATTVGTGSLYGGTVAP